MAEYRRQLHKLPVFFPTTEEPVDEEIVDEPQEYKIIGKSPEKYLKEVLSYGDKATYKEMLLSNERFARAEKEIIRLRRMVSERDSKIFLLEENQKHLKDKKDQALKKCSRTRKRAATEKTQGYTVERPILGPDYTDVMTELSKDQT